MESCWVISYCNSFTKFLISIIYLLLFFLCCLEPSSLKQLLFFLFEVVISASNSISRHSLQGAIVIQDQESSITISIVALKQQQRPSHSSYLWIIISQDWLTGFMSFLALWRALSRDFHLVCLLWLYHRQFESSWTLYISCWLFSPWQLFGNKTLNWNLLTLWELCFQLVIHMAYLQRHLQE